MDSLLPSNIEITNLTEESETEEPSAQATSKKVATRHSYTLNDHSQYLQLQAETCGGWYHIPNLDIDPTVKEYIVPIPDVELDQLYVGLLRHHQDVDYHFELLPYVSVQIYWSELSWMLLFTS
jgi:hypothetical protein